MPSSSIRCPVWVSSVRILLMILSSRVAVAQPWAVRLRGTPVRSQSTFGKPHPATARAGGCLDSPRIGGLRYANPPYVTAWRFDLLDKVGGDGPLDHRQHRWRSSKMRALFVNDGPRFQGVAALTTNIYYSWWPASGRMEVSDSDSRPEHRVSTTEIP